MNFFIASIGHSGTHWMAQVLNDLDGYRVASEIIDTSPRFDLSYSPFPVERWQGEENYGECHGKLGRYLSPYVEGPERAIPRRAILLRDSKAVVRSWMNGVRIKRRWELAWVMYAVLRARKQLLDYVQSDSEVKIILLEEVLQDGIQPILNWLDYSGPLPEIPPPVHESTVRFEWDDNSSKQFKQMWARFGSKIPEGRSLTL